ncbi:hypothetical protein [Paenibacillus koleovorans]|uniref:hypothetical protein n=1 Tax=Paenibacillus koleovorans TaxID=121608 RepID=UPI000FDA083F|nr:hypothetical protein [Paenibacillus koleovorans]
MKEDQPARIAIAFRHPSHVGRLAETKQLLYGVVHGAKPKLASRFAKSAKRRTPALGRNEEESALLGGGKSQADRTNAQGKVAKKERSRPS